MLRFSADKIKMYSAIQEKPIPNGIEIEITTPLLFKKSMQIVSKLSTHNMYG